MTDCTVTEASLWEWLDATRELGAEDELGRHIESCTVCRARVEEMRRLHSGLWAAAQPEAAPLPKSIGPYEIVRYIGEGGMGTVYEAQQTEPTRRVALKVVHERAQQRRHFQLFRREIEALARLRHPNIARIYDAGRTEDGQQYFAMELIEGRPLLAHCEHADLSYRDRLGLFQQLCEAVTYAHQRGVIHRDLKPANVLVDDNGDVHVLDFGLARIVDPDHEASITASVSHALVGTLPYMSPEQARGDGADLDIRTDVYSLGVILYEMLTGQYPYEVVGPMAAVLQNIREAAPARPSSIRRHINTEVERIVLRTLAKEREQRYASADALGRDVERYLAGEPVEAMPYTAWYQLRKLVARHRFAAAVVGLLAVITISFVSINVYFISKTRQLSGLLSRIDEAHRAEERVADLRGQAVEDLVNWRYVERFLKHWHSGDLDGARRVVAHLAPDSVERKIVSCWLDPRPLSDKSAAFESHLAGGPTHFKDLVVGEQRLKENNRAGAVTAFEACRAALEADLVRNPRGGNDAGDHAASWLRHWIQVRMGELTQGSASATTRAAARSE